MIDIGNKDFVMETVMKIVPNRPCKGCNKTDNTDCAGGMALCKRCGQEFEVIPQEFNVLHHRKACHIPPHNALCGRGCFPRGISYIDLIPHFDQESCEICKKRTNGREKL